MLNEQGLTIRSSGLAYGKPLTSNYKGFPLCQANEFLEPRSGSIHI